jgi:phospholipid/cholesterol/gamma-HCH transport system ATP-binding protein
MGVVFQSGAILNWLTVRENVALPLVERGEHRRAEIDDIVGEMLSVLQLSDAADKMPAEISGGMKKRVCLARVLVRRPGLILYDEPTSGLDPVMASVINELVVRFRDDRGVTSIAVTHDMESAYRIADRIAVLYEGAIIQCDTPAAIRESENPVVRQLVRGELQGPIRV